MSIYLLSLLQIIRLRYVSLTPSILIVDSMSDGLLSRFFSCVYQLREENTNYMNYFSTTYRCAHKGAPF
jgi:hypothetical protein